MQAALPASINPIVISYPPDQCINYENLLPLILARLPVDEPFILFGESFSGPLAVMISANRPANLVGVILCATFVTPPRPFVGWAIRLLARPSIFSVFPTAQRLKAIIGGNATPEILALFSQVHAVLKPEVAAFRVRTVFRVDARDQLRLCDAPMLYIAAENDKVVPDRNIKIIRKIKPNLQVVTIDAPHAIPLARPVQVAAAIDSFAALLQSNGA